MSSIVRTQLVDVVAAELHRRLVAGELKDRLPGTRLLAKALGVSVPTVCKALHKLRDDGALTGGGGRKRWQVGDLNEAAVRRSAMSPKRARSRPGRLTFVSALPLSTERQSGVEVFAHVLDMMSAKGWEVTHRHVGFVSARKPHRAWDELLRFSKPDAMMVLGGSEVFGSWVMQRQIRTLFIGGESGRYGIPMVMVRASLMLRQALEKLFSTGHRRIVIPLCGRIPKFSENCKKQTFECAMELGVDPACVVHVESEYSSPEVLAAAMRQQWRKQAPDALIIFDWREYLAVSHFLKEAAISIPHDVSVVLLSHNPTMDWHIPTLCHFMHPVEDIARACAKWALNGKPLPGGQQILEFRPQWVEGNSIANRTKKARPV